MRNIHIARVSEIGIRQPDSLHSPRVQFKRMSDWTLDRGDTILHEWDEMDVSAKLPLHRRPKLRTAVEMIEAGDADNLVFAFFDRSVRNMKVQLEIIERIEAVDGANLWVLDHGKLTNVNAVGRYMNNVMGSTNQFYGEITGEKVVSAQEEAIALGHYALAKVPPGYRRGPDKCLVVHEPERPHVVEAFAMRDAVPPASYIAIRDYLAANGIERSVNGVVAMLTNEAYIGVLRFGKHVNPTGIPPIIDPDVFARVSRTRTTGGRKSKSPRLLSRLGVLRCGSCGGSLIMNARAGHYACCDNGKRKCPRKVTIRAERIEGIVLAAVRMWADDARGQASAQARIRAADEKVTTAEANLASAFRVFEGYQNELAARAAIDKAQAALDEAKRERGALGPGRVRKLVKPSDIDRHPNPERRQELWRELISAADCVVTIMPAASRHWDDSRIRLTIEGIEVSVKQLLSELV